MKDNTKIKLADKILSYVDELQKEDDPMYEDDELFDEPKGPKVVVKVKPKKGK